MRKLAALLLLGALHAQDPEPEAPATDEYAALRDRVAARIEEVTTGIEIGAVGAVGQAPEEDLPPVRQKFEAGPVAVEVPSLAAPSQLQWIPRVAAQRILKGDMQTFALVRQQLAESAAAGEITEELRETEERALRKMAADAAAVRESIEKMKRPLARKLKIDTDANLYRLRYAAGKSVAGTGAASHQESAALADEALGAHVASDREPVIVPPALDAPMLRAPRAPRVLIQPPAPDAAIKPQGVKIQIDEAMLAKVLRAQGLDAGVRELLQLEDAVVKAGSGAEAFRRVHEYTEAKKAEFVERFHAFRDLGKPHFVSLTDLVERAKRYRKRWHKRPGELRTVGGLTRIHGYLRQANGDFLLVGRIEPGAPEILFDDLTVGLRAVWRDGMTPLVSLDPDANNFGGLMHARVGGVPGDSAFALAMLEADYQAKLITYEAPGYDVPGFTSLADLTKDMTERIMRFWLYPVQPTGKSIQLGPGASSALFDAEVQVLTEDAMRTASGVAFTGRSDPIAAAAARSFTQNYDAIARRHAELQRLRGLFDIVMLAKVLRLTAPGDETVASACALPYESVAVPKAYRGVTVDHPRDGWLLRFEGGCEMQSRVRWRNLMEAGSASHARLVAGEALLVPDAAGGPADSEQHYLRATRFFEEMRFGEADEAFTRAIDLEPSFAGAYARRGVVRFLSGRRRAGLWDAAQAVSLSPTDVELQVIFYRMLFESGTPNPLKGASPVVREVIAETYRLAARVWTDVGFYKQAKDAVDKALRINPDAVAALTLRAEARRRGGDANGALKDVNRALELAPQDMRALFERSAVYDALQQRHRAIKDLNKALDLNRSDLTLRGACLEARSRIRLARRDFEGAGEDATFAIEITPKFWRPYATRGLALMGIVDRMPKDTNDQKIMNRIAMCCTQALASIDKALRLGPKHDPEFQRMEQQLRQIRDALKEMAER